MSEWRKIETAPKATADDIRVLVYDPRMKQPVEIRLTDGDWWRKYSGPTHWMSLPSPPETDK